MSGSGVAGADPGRAGKARGHEHEPTADPRGTGADPRQMGADPREPAIAVHGLRAAFGRREVLGGVTFRVARGELFALLGPNGAGKTTTVDHIVGFRRPRSGEVRVLGRDPVRDGRRLRPRVGVMLQAGGIDPRSTPIEALRLHARFHRDPADPEALVELLGLRTVARTRYRRLSGGERQRLGFALALIGRPDLLVLDEPTAGMDPEAKERTRVLLGALRSAGTSILLTTHELADVERLADRVALLDQGRIVALGTVPELTGQSTPRLRFRLSTPLAEPTRRLLEDRLAATAGPGRRVRLAEDGASGRYTFEGTPATPPLLLTLTSFLAAHDALLVELRATGATLEDRYLELVRGDGPAGSGAAGPGAPTR